MKLANGVMMHDFSRAILGVLVQMDTPLPSVALAEELRSAGHEATPRQVTLCIRHELVGLLNGGPDEGWSLLSSARDYAREHASEMPAPFWEPVATQAHDQVDEPVRQHALPTPAVSQSEPPTSGGSLASAIAGLLLLEAALLALGFWLPGFWFIALAVVPLVLSARNDRRYRLTGSGKAVRRYQVEPPDSIDRAWGLISGIAVLLFALLVAFGSLGSCVAG